MPELSCGGKCMKYTLFIFNFIFFLSGAAVMGIGIWMKVDRNIGQYLIVIAGNPNDPLYNAAVITLITVGAFVFLVGFLGCCGACKESQCMLCTYVVLLCVVFVAELVGGILAIVFRNKLGDALRDEMQWQAIHEVKREYTDTTAANAAWHAMQINLRCCGGVGYMDYRNNTNMTTLEPVPWTCCVMKQGESDPQNPQPENPALCLADARRDNVQDSNNLYTKGCYNELNRWMGDKVVILIGVGIGIAALQIFGIAFACCVRKEILEGEKYA